MENVKSTSTLKISLAVLNSDTLMERLKESTIDIRTVEIESTCKLHRVLSKYSLPSCLNVLRINDNNLNLQDISELLKSSTSLSSLHILVLCHTVFEDSSFYALISVLSNCKDLISLSLTNNGLTKQEVNCLIAAFESMRNLEKLNLSKSNITETQANNILQELEQANKIASLDLSHNALQGKEVIVGICQLQSLQEVDLSHNYIRFFPLPDFQGKHDSLSINMKIISLSCNHMTPLDISKFCSLVRSDLLKLNLDFNHVGNSIWSLSALGLKSKHLKVLSLANTYISGAVDALAPLLSCLGELEELNLSSNNLISADFEQLQIPLSNMSQLKMLNLSNNPDGISTLLEKILPSLKNLEELRLSNTHINFDDLKRISDSLAFLKSIKYLELGMNAIGPDGIRTLANILKGFPLLEWLDLSRCCFHHDDVMVLCQCLVPLKKMKYLNLSGNMLDCRILGDGWFLPSTLEELVLSDVIHGEKLFAKMKPLHNLKKLHLTNLKLRACDVEVLATTLSSFPKLEELNLANIVADSNLNKLFCAIKPLKNIKNIDLSGISLHNEIALSDMLSSLSCLEELVLSGMSVANMDEKRLFGSIQLLKRLRKLDLGGINVREAKALLDMLPSLLLLEEIVFPAVVLGDIGGTVGYFGALVSLRYLKNVDLRWTEMFKSAKEGLARTLPSLQMLQRLVLGDMIGSDSKKEIYVALGNLKYLKEVDLGRSYITQTGTAETLGRVLPSWTLLEKLVLHKIRHWYEYVEQLFATLGNLKYLKELHLGYVNITESDAKTLVHVFSSLTLLEKLVLEKIGSYDKCDEQLFAALGNLKYLKELHLVRMNITESGIEALAHVLPSLTLLEKLVLEGNGFDDDKCDEQLLAALGNLKYLKELHLGNVNITEPCTRALARVLLSLTLLEKLVLEGIDSYDECDEQLFAALGNLKYLKELHLGNVNITEPGTRALARVLLSSTLLEKLVLEGNGSDDECDEQLFAALGNLKYLKELHLGEINITESGIEALAHVLPSLTLLEKLVLEGIDSYGECDEQLFAALGNLKYLKELQLRWLRVSPNGAEALARASPSLQMLKVLQLHWFALEDDIFHALRGLRFLEELDLERIEMTKAGVAALADVIPSLGLLKKLRLKCISISSDDQLFTAVGSLSFLNELELLGSTITQAGANSLTTTLPRLRNLRKFRLPKIENDEDGTLRKNLQEAASFVPFVC